MIIQYIPPNTNRRPGIKMVPKYITIHSTGNPLSTAKNEANNVTQNNMDLKVSFHFVVDDKETYNVMPINEVAWHAGDGGGDGNMKSIGIEICESGDREKALLNAAELVKYLMIKLSIPTSKVVQHNHWSGKNCPRILRERGYIKNGMNWDWFIKKLESEDKVIYKTFKDLPEYAKPTIKKLMDKKVLTGDALGNINLSEDMVRLFVVHDRLGIYG